ncbi:MAG: glycine dehydrogenase, partial [Opitutae bacterium]|nr:glycine dehydrogenase [Opitutae bacterium]
PVFNEFVAEFPHDFAPVRERLLARGIVAGLELGAFYPELAGRYLFCVTETIEKKDMDAVAAEVRA